MDTASSTGVIGNPPDPLNPDEANTLATQEAIIERGLQTFYEVGNALVAIRDRRLYRQAHATFEEYCRGRWGMERRYAYRLMDAAAVVENVSNWTQTLPATESQARPLVGLPREQQGPVWNEAVQTAKDGKVTAAHVAATVERLTAPPPPPPPEPPYTYSTSEHQDSPEVGYDAALAAGRLPLPADLRAVHAAERAQSRDQAVADTVEVNQLIMDADATVNDGGVAKIALLRELGRDLRSMLAYKEDDICAAFDRHPYMDHVLTDLHRVRRLAANIERRCAVIQGGKGRSGEGVG